MEGEHSAEYRVKVVAARMGSGAFKADLRVEFRGVGGGDIEPYYYERIKRDGQGRGAYVENFEYMMDTANWESMEKVAKGATND